MSLKHPASDSFSYAFDGVRLAMKEEPNFKIHFVFSIVATLLALVLGFTALEMAILVLTISTVLILELINTALEALVDIVSPQIQMLAKQAKDVSAAAVLVSAISSLLIGLLLFTPKIVALLY